MTVGDRIKYMRESLGLSQEDLAKKIGLKDKSSITKIEKSGDNVTLKNVEKLSTALGCSIQYLMGWNAELTDDEKRALNLFRNATPEIKSAALSVLKAGQQQNAPPE